MDDFFYLFNTTLERGVLLASCLKHPFRLTSGCLDDETWGLCTNLLHSTIR